MSDRNARKVLLFTGGGGAGSEALDRLLGQRYEVHFADADILARPATIAAERWHAIALAAADDFMASVQNLCRKLGVHVLIPGVDEELSIVARNRAQLACEVLLPPVEFVATHLDKLASNEQLRRQGVPVPHTTALSAADPPAFPCVVKPRSGRGSRGVAVVRSLEELHAHVLLNRRSAEDFILQELLEGQEYTTTLVADRAARLAAIVPVRVAIKRGITLRARTERDEAVMRASAAIHASNPVAGCYNIQLVKGADGVARPFEINPRISTTACLALAAGVDFLDLWLNGRAGDEPAPFHNHLGLRRSWHNEFIHE
jgi:carbamoyl-phosphate synthase large subunit